jgi:hypothetical protein
VAAEDNLRRLSFKKERANSVFVHTFEVICKRGSMGVTVSMIMTIPGDDLKPQKTRLAWLLTYRGAEPEVHDARPQLSDFGDDNCEVQQATEDFNALRVG